MKWATTELIHFDRVASAWLIRRFIDRNAEFTFLAPAQTAEEDTTVFGVPGVGIGAHDGTSTAFQRLMAAHGLDDPALRRLAAVIADVVDHVMQDAGPAALVRRGPLVGGALAVAEGLMLLSTTDAECLDRSLPFYDALFARLQAQVVIDEQMRPDQNSPLAQTLEISRATRELRRRGEGFSAHVLGEALRSPVANDS